MRSALIALAALSLTATPALAADSKAQRQMEKMADVLNNPVTQEAAADSLGAMLGALMDIRIDGFVKALEPLNKGKRIKLKGNTLGEIAAREDPNFERKMENGTRAAVGSMGALASALAVAMPQLEEAMEKMEDALPKGF